MNDRPEKRERFKKIADLPFKPTGMVVCGMNVFVCDGLNKPAIVSRDGTVTVIELKEYDE